MNEINLAPLLESGLHFGHKAYSWNPKMFPYIYKEQNNIHILDLVQSAKLLNQANIYCRNAAKEGKNFLFVGTKQHVKSIIFDVAERSKSFYVNERWLGGILTNWVTLKDRINYLKALENQVFKNLSKKEASAKRKKLEKIRKYLNGIKEMDVLPDIVIIIDSNNEITAVKECQALKIPIISILDTNCNPDLIDIPIPGNDDSIQSIKIILNSLTNNIICGKQQKLI
jgi:small subunit ribosomal protein S2